MRHAVVVGRGLNYANAFEFCAEADGDLLRGGRALLFGRLSARAHRDGRAQLSGVRLCAAGGDWPSMGDTLAKLQGLQAEIVAITDPETARWPRARPA